MQETNSASGLATAGMATAAESEDMAALRAELAKWQERVPKLAGALRERSGEVESLKAELARLRENGAPADGADSSSGIQARDALIEELEAKVRALSGKYQDTEGQLRARDLEISQLREEAQEWREKWQAATGNLDQQAQAADQKDRELKRLQRELDELLALQDGHKGRIKEQDLELAALKERAQSLESRNENLFETTELANRQIEALGENLEQLRTELKASQQALAARESEHGDAAKVVDDLKGQIASRDRDIEFLHGHVEEKQTEIVRLGERLSELEPLQGSCDALAAEKEALSRQLEERDTEIGALSERLTALEEARKALGDAQADQERLAGEIEAVRAELAAAAAARDEKQEALEAEKSEVRRLEECVARAEEATSRFETERRQLSEQMDELRKRNQHLEAQLSERSNLVVGLEQEKSIMSSKSSSLEAENKRLSEALEKSQQSASGNADYIAQVDARLERQKQLMANLEAEFAEVQEEHAEALKAHQRTLAEKDAEIASLRTKADDDSAVVLQAELADLESLLEEARAESRTLEARLDEEQKRAESLAREIAEEKTGEESARESLNEKIEELEKQLRKQSIATAEAEEAAAEARAALEVRQAEASRVPDAISDENALLQAEVIKLEGMVRERTEQLNKLRWQQDMLEKQSGAEGSSNKMLVVLNQQLESARQENQRLKNTIRALESRTAGSDADDLASIKGIGPKLVKQLAKLGISRFDQIATLSEADLDDPDHPLHPMKGRILKDEWIRQAARLGGV